MLLPLLVGLATADTGDDRPVHHDDEAVATSVYTQGENGCGGPRGGGDGDSGESGDTGEALLLLVPFLGVAARRRRA